MRKILNTYSIISITISIIILSCVSGTQESKNNIYQQPLLIKNDNTEINFDSLLHLKKDGILFLSFWSGMNTVEFNSAIKREQSQESIDSLGHYTFSYRTTDETQPHNLASFNIEKLSNQIDELEELILISEHQSILLNSGDAQFAKCIDPLLLKQLVDIYKSKYGDYIKKKQPFPGTSRSNVQDALLVCDPITLDFITENKVISIEYDYDCKFTFSKDKSVKGCIGSLIIKYQSRKRYDSINNKKGLIMDEKKNLLNKNKRDI